MKCGCRDNVVNDLLEKMPDTTAFTDLPDLALSSSAPLGGKGLAGGPRLNKQVSRGAAAAERKRIAANRANQLIGILNSFCGIEK